MTALTAVAWTVCVRTALVTRGGGARPLARARALQRLMNDVLAAHGVVITTAGSIPSAAGIVVANHVSYLDALVLPALLPSTCVAKREVATWPVVGAAAAQHGVLFVDRGCAWSGARLLRRAAAALRAGVSVVAFPEGTTTCGGGVLPFKRGLFGLARRLGVTIWPAAIQYDTPALAWVGDQAFLGHYLRTLALRSRTEARVSFAEPIAPARGLEPAVLAEEARRRIARLLRA